MKTMMVLAAFLAPASAIVPSQVGTTEFICVGKGKEFSNPGGRAKLGPITFRIVTDGQRATVVRLTQFISDGLPVTNEASFCWEDSVCKTAVTDTQIEVNSSGVPGTYSGGTATFSLDRKNLRFLAHGGGLDQDWSLSGKCKIDKR